MKTMRPLVGALVATTLLAGTGGTIGNCPPAPTLLAQSYVTLPGFVQPNTPGSGASIAMPTTTAVQRVVGPTPDLNRVNYIRTFQTKPSGQPPRAVLILVPGFLGGATNFTPLAKQLVQRFNGNLEVWAIDRRPNQLEDRRGTDYAKAQLAAGNSAGFVDALQFYFPDLDPALGSNPFPTDTGDIDVDGDGVFDPPFALPDALGGSSAFQLLSQDDLRFAAHWGIDSYARDWKILVDQARSVVGRAGLVLFGGHSMGTGFAGMFAAYDFDPGPGIDAAHTKIDGLLLLEGGGPGTGSANITFSSNGTNLPPLPRPTTSTAYDALVAQLETAGGPDSRCDLQAYNLRARGGRGNRRIDGHFRPGQPAVAGRPC